MKTEYVTETGSLLTEPGDVIKFSYIFAPMSKNRTMADIIFG